jgi:hypothetical protein
VFAFYASAAGPLLRTVKRLSEYTCMQPPPFPETLRVNYLVPRDVLIRTWWRRVMLRPRRAFFMILMAVFAAACFVLRGGMEYAGIVFAVLLLLMPINLYRVLAKAADGDRAWTDPKTVEFGPSQIVVTGPNWKAEMPWTRFKRFSEDAEYFYLDLSEHGVGSVVPKSAFSAEQVERFREYARAQVA